MIEDVGERGGIAYTRGKGLRATYAESRGGQEAAASESQGAQHLVGCLLLTLQLAPGSAPHRRMLTGDFACLPQKHDCREEFQESTLR